jgi:hypothetical protein
VKWAPQTEAAGATAGLPGHDTTFVQQRAVASKADRIFIALKAAPPFNGRAPQAANPFAFWAQAASVWRSRTRWVVEAPAAATDRRECTRRCAAARSGSRHLERGSSAALAGGNAAKRDHIKLCLLQIEVRNNEQVPHDRRGSRGP